MAFKMNSFSGFGNGTGSSFKKETNYLDDKTNPAKKTKSGPKGKAGSELRKKEYDARGWKYDDTIAGYNRDGTKKKENTTEKIDSSKKDNKSDSKIDPVNAALNAHSIYEVGKYAKKKLLKKVGKETVKKGARNLFRKAATRIVTNPYVSAALGAGGLGYLGYKIIDKEIKEPGSNYKEQEKNIKKTAKTNYKYGGHSVMGHGK